ncbi:MAG: hypothetical protein P8I27_13235 [Pirellulaceae bacterium]|nr:hypothetical protein [Pirellulaceae bacterium]
MELVLVVATVLLAIQAPQLATAQCNTTLGPHTFQAPKIDARCAANSAGTGSLLSANYDSQTAGKLMEHNYFQHPTGFAGNPSAAQTQFGRNAPSRHPNNTWSTNIAPTFLMEGVSLKHKVPPSPLPIDPMFKQDLASEVTKALCGTNVTSQNIVNDVQPFHATRLLEWTGELEDQLTLASHADFLTLVAEVPRSPSFRRPEYDHVELVWRSSGLELHTFRDFIRLRSCSYKPARLTAVIPLQAKSSHGPEKGWDLHPNDTHPNLGIQWHLHVSNDGTTRFTFGIKTRPTHAPESLTAANRSDAPPRIAQD